MPATPTDSPKTMWEGQAELRWSMERLADEALDRSGIELDPRGFLVGVPAKDDGSEMPVIIEPSRRAFDIEGPAHLMSDADNLLQQQILPFPDDSNMPKHYRAAVREGFRRKVVVEALEEAARFDDRHLCVGMSVRIGDYRVFPVLSVLKDPWEELPRLASTEVDGRALDCNFAEAVISDVLRAASHELDRKNPTSLIGVDAGAILRSAVDTFVNGCATRTGQIFSHGLRDALDAVSSQAYEGRASVGNVIIAAPTSTCVAREVTFEHHVPASVPRSFRKALEMSGSGLELLCDGREVYGLGHMQPGYDEKCEESFSVRVVGNGSWELWHASTPLLRVDNGQPTLPRDLVDADTFRNTVRRVFPHTSPDDAQVLWDMAQACIAQQHGTMLVVHPDASAEGARLLPQAYTVEPTRLGPSAFSALTKIDGAILVSPEGLCHAVGVILDGAATGTGDISRGARYNSAIRYLAGMGRGSMVIIVSEDGRIDILPQHARRVRRSYVERAVKRLVLASGAHEDFEKFGRLNAQVQKYEFYLDADQCRAVNEARESMELRRWAAERVRMQVVPIIPHPAMDDSYFIETTEQD